MQVNLTLFESIDPFFPAFEESSLLQEIAWAALLFQVLEDFDFDSAAERLKERVFEVKTEKSETEEKIEAVKTAALPKIEEVEEEKETDESAEASEDTAKSEEKTAESGLESID